MIWNLTPPNVASAMAKSCDGGAKPVGDVPPTINAHIRLEAELPNVKRASEALPDDMAPRLLDEVPNEKVALLMLVPKKPAPATPSPPLTTSAPVVVLVLAVAELTTSGPAEAICTDGEPPAGVSVTTPDADVMLDPPCIEMPVPVAA